jgi:ATP-dependent helicase/nuclease subunit A
MPLFGSSDPAAAALVETQSNQAAAADPVASAWVSANAGTGKTHVLTMRVLRLLLAQEPPQPERILALTYTKAAASEMATRVFARLAEWVTASEPDLKAKLGELLSRAPTAEEIMRARRLFARAIETPGGLKVQTIHAFCERLLQRFPLEAGVPAGFEILDDQQRAALLKEAVDGMLTVATTPGSNPQLARALEMAVGFAAEMTFDDLLAEAMRQREWLDAAVRLDLTANDSLREAEKIYRAAIGLDAQASLEKANTAAAGVLSDADITRARGILASSGSTRDGEGAARLTAALAAAGTAARVGALTAFFFTTGGDPRKDLLTKGLARSHPDVAGRLGSAQTAFIALHEQRCKLQLLEATLALVRLANAAMQGYGEAKARRAALDFDDLIGKASSLLRSSGAVEWVLYKLDGGLDHILVDEAQDTSPLQWQVIRALAEEFFAGTGSHDGPRTLFAVGDEKQSIYSFQGAAPAMFGATGNAFAERAAQGGLPWRRIPLTLSFRSVAPLLDAVDRIFAKPELTPGVATGTPIRHVAHRAGHAGLVEIWPTEKYQAATSTEPWSPLEEASTTPAVVRLANRIAGTIDKWIKDRETLASESRPIRAGDILILVRKRQPLAAAMITALKTRGIGVAGADRLVLTDQIAVQDLMALGDFLTLPSDDLALASVLKSPLIGWTDDDLMTLAPGRTTSLWHQMRSRSPSDARVNEAVRTLSDWQARAGQMPPFEFYARLLDVDGARARLLARLGAEAADAVDEFLNLAMAYDDGAPPSLQGFLAWLREGKREIKRDMEQGRDQVRVMTVHGAKGLEAPIVFLPDTCTTRSARQPNGLLTLDDAARPSAVPPPFLWPVKGTSKVPCVQAAKAKIGLGETEERNRLLYVALTRARDRLYVAGFEGAQSPPQDCWYNLIMRGLEGQLSEITTPDGRTVWRMVSAQTAKPEKLKARTADALAFAPLPKWVGSPAPREPMLTMPLVPTRLAPLEREADETEPALRSASPRARVVPDEPPILPPAALADDARFLRGTLTHALLEHLPTVASDRRKAAAEAFLVARAAQLPVGVRRQIAEETLAVLEDPQFADLFGPDSRAEVAIAAEIPRPDGSSPALRLNGKIDRLVRAGNMVRIVDFKTNRPPPADVSRVPDAYLLQLAAYRLGIARIFPGTRVEAAILWTDGPQIMAIPDESLDSHEQGLWQLDPTNLDA